MTRKQIPPKTLLIKNFDGDKKNLNILIKEFLKEKELSFEKIEEEKNIKFINRDKFDHKNDKCLARIWNCGRGGQCSNKGVDEGFCKKHSKKKHDWWLGTINSPRPERPIHHNGKLHKWIN